MLCPKTRQQPKLRARGPMVPMLLPTIDTQNHVKILAQHSVKNIKRILSNPMMMRVIAGQGTVGLEIAQQIAAMGLTMDAVMCCCGGGGLIAGLGIAVHAHAPKTSIWCAEPEFYDDTKRSLERGSIQRQIQINRQSVMQL